VACAAPACLPPRWCPPTGETLLTLLALAQELAAWARGRQPPTVTLKTVSRR
jgi:hypothetical protein